ncbi:MAG: site-specific DNA-methyltransferase [Actinobacteria bacterium]|nr:site-specific DNA-methyltransferase [Actinomycetota bacterium]
MCSYFAMFPPALANVMVQWLSEPGDVVYDPFSGRGTVPLEARRLGRVAVAADLSPLAVTLSRAKSSSVSSAEVAARLAELETACRRARPRINNVPPHIAMLFSQRTLRQLLALRLRLDIGQDEDAFVMGMLLGIMHLNADSQGRPRGLSIAMPNTFAMAPNYVRRYIDEHRLEPPEVDVFGALRRRLEDLAPDSVGGPSGRTYLRDATLRSPAQLDGRVRLLLSSPPYLNVIKYAKFNWVRLWMLRHDPKAVDAKLMASASLDKYLPFLCETLRAQAPAMRADGLACLVIGDVRREAGNLRLAEIVSDTLSAKTGWKTLGIVADELPQDRKVSRIWGTRKGRATRTDRLLLLRPPSGTADLPRVPEIDWCIERSRREVACC